MHVDATATGQNKQSCQLQHEKGTQAAAKSCLRSAAAVHLLRDVQQTPSPDCRIWPGRVT